MSRRRAVLAARVGVLAAMVLTLEALCRAGVIDPATMIAPSAMAASMLAQLASGDLTGNVVETFSTVGAAFLCAVVLGTLAGAAIHAIARLRRAVEPVLAAYYSVPTFVFYPLLVSLLGLSMAPLVVLGVMSAAPAMLIATIAGLDRVPGVLLKVARVQRLGRARTLWLVVLPAAMPYLFGGIKLALSYALIGVIAGEFILSASGLGYAISFAYQSFDTAAMYGLMLFVLLVAVTANGLLYAWEGRLARRRARGVSGALAMILLALGAWQGVASWTQGVAITPPLATFAYTATLLATARFWSNVAETLAAFGLAFAISAVAGLLLGLLLGARRFAGDVAEPILAGFYTIPKVTLYPVVLLVCGLGMSAKVAFGVMHGLVPVTLFTLGAVKALPPVLMRAARAMRLTPWQAMRSVLLPACLPQIVAGLRVGFSLSLLGVLIGEMFSSQRGLGFLVVNGMAQHNVALTTSVVLVIVLFAIGANAALGRLFRLS